MSGEAGFPELEAGLPRPEVGLSKPEAGRPEAKAGLPKPERQRLDRVCDECALRRPLDPRGMRVTGDAAICRHDPSYPAGLAGMRGAPRVLYVAGGVERFEQLTSEPVVAIVGARRATDYGMETARGLARGLAASGVTVISALADGIAAAAHMGALEVDGPTVTVMPSGLDICYPASRRALYERVRKVGCALSERPWGHGEPRWSALARERIVVGLARMVIVVEAQERPGPLAAARLATALGRTVGAMPGRVSSPMSEGPHALLAAGARLVRGPQDALDALYGVGAKQAPAREIPAEAQLRDVLEQVGGGRDTPAKLIAVGGENGQTMAALAELELSGALVRGDGGRYLPRG